MKQQHRLSTKAIAQFPNKCLFIFLIWDIQKICNSLTSFIHWRIHNKNAMAMITHPSTRHLEIFKVEIMLSNLVTYFLISHDPVFNMT